MAFSLVPPGGGHHKGTDWGVGYQDGGIRETPEVLRTLVASGGGRSPPP